eukprot:294169-Chlamydomonas_euryale.AAC.1
MPCAGGSGSHRVFCSRSVPCSIIIGSTLLGVTPGHHVQRTPWRGHPCKRGLHNDFLLTLLTRDFGPTATSLVTKTE